MVDGAFYAQKCYYWVTDQKKIKSNELVVTVVIGVLGIYDTKMRKPRSSYATRSQCQVATLAPEPIVYCYGYRKHRLEKECLRCSRCTSHFSVTSLMNKFEHLEAEFTYINLRTWICPACLGLCNCRECATQLLTPPPPSQDLL
ncbi:hypothetical protein CTI12_AA384050 [Artemisia annua]|uniref:Uncharacterized protein n=1 Tax=Artemisia annua TaxID=35608 RepID=A0A2U1MFI3_ARTAN|nr:hypothetical protein CTI12_AA384050 [Artemisia annua]